MDSVDEAGRVGFNVDDDTSLSSLLLRLSQYKRQYRFPSLLQDARAKISGRTDENEGSERSSGYSIAEKEIPFGFGDALGGLSELLSLLSSYNIAVNAPENSSTKLLIGLVATLKIISAYLQIVDLFNNLLASLHEQMVSIGYVQLQTLPGLSLGNSAINQGNLQT
ncbi:hypothetical protein DM02DRAFT_634030 [Periconia macrospinosa]|uniref:Uncharacterized protein n=1 Tax=Periconia macrospinosa TaxID=97972 RepID=A0A2V1D7L7_9PLEO|nr:hypothetical protein DM02DRAFT_634030 [Periconia macrospinosa]